MVKKSKQTKKKQIEEESKRRKKKAQKEKHIEEEEPEDEEEEEEEEEENEEMKGFLVSDEDDSQVGGRNDRNVYRDETIFNKKENKSKNDAEDEKDEKYIKEEDDEEEEAESDEKLEDSDLEVAEEVETGKKKKKKLHKTGALKKKGKDIKKEFRDLADFSSDYDKRSDSNEANNNNNSSRRDQKKNIKRSNDDDDDFIEKEDYSRNANEEDDSEGHYDAKKNSIKIKKRNENDFIDDGDNLHFKERYPEEFPKHKQKTTNLVERAYFSEEEKRIIEADYPERLLTRYSENELSSLYQEIKAEQEWISEQMKKSYIDTPNIKKKIHTLLEYYKKNFYDVPYIVNYKSYIYEPEMTKKDVWEIFELDKEYQKLNDLRKKVINSFALLEPYLNEKIYQSMKEKYIENAKSIQELRNMMSYIEYNKEKYLTSSSGESYISTSKNINNNINNRHEDYDEKNPPLENEKEGHQEHIGPLRKSMISFCFSKKLDKFTKEFWLDSNDIAANIEMIRNKEETHNLIKPPEPDCALSDKLSEYTTKNTSEGKVVENISNLISKEMINHPYIKEFVYEHFRDNCYVSTTPTEEGETQLDVFNPSFRTKRIKERPIKTFDNDLFLDVIQKEKANLITVKIEVKEKEEDENNFKYIFTQALNSSSNENNKNNQNSDIKTENDDFNDGTYRSNWKNDPQNEWSLLRENVINIFLESINKQFIIDIKKELKENAENYVINQCAEKFYQLLMSGPYIVDTSEIYDLNRHNNNSGNNNNNNNNNNSNEDEENNSENESSVANITDRKFRDDESPKVMSFIYDQNKGETYCIYLDQNGVVIDEKTFNFVFQRQNRKRTGNKNQEQETLTHEQELCQKLIEKYEPNLIIIGANDLKSRFIKEQLSTIVSQTKFTSNSQPWITFGDLSIPIIYSNSQISENEFPDYNMFIRQGISLGRYQQNPLQEILQLWKEDISENYCLKIKLHPMQKYVDQNNLMEKMETKAIEVVNACGFDLNKAYEFSHMRNTLMFISGFGPKKAKNFNEQLLIQGKPKSRQKLKELDCFKLGPVLSVSFLNFIKIKTDVTQKNQFENEEDYDLLDMTRIPMESYEIAKKLVNDVFDTEEKGKKKKKHTITENEKIEEIIRDPKKLDIVDINEYIKKQNESLSRNNQFPQVLNFCIRLIISELKNPFKDPRHNRKDLEQRQIFYLLIGDENFKEGVLTVAKVTRVDQEHVQCKLQNDLGATVWVKDIFEDSETDKDNYNKAKEKMKSMFKPGSAFEARVKSIDYNNYKADLMTKPSEMESHKKYIANVEQLLNFFELTDEDKMNLPYIKSHSEKNRKYHVRNIKYNRFQNMSYTDCCNYLKKKDVGECVFRPSSKGDNNLTLSYKFYRSIICHIDIVEEEKIPGESIGKRLRISNEVYSSLDEIYKRYVIPCAQIIKESVVNRKFYKAETKSEFENKLKDDKKNNMKIINYNFTILKDYPGYIVLGYVPKSNPIFEYIKVKPKGLFFHDEYYNSLDAIISFFKSDFASEKYRDYVRKTLPPNVQYHRTLESYNNNNSLFDSRKSNDFGNAHSNILDLNEGEGGYNNYRGDSSNMNNNRSSELICHKCNMPGHKAKDCPNRDNNNSGYNNNYRNDRGDKDKRRGDNNNNNNKYTGGKRNRDNRDNSHNDYRRDNNRGHDRDWDNNRGDKHGGGSNFGWKNNNSNNNNNFKKEKDEDNWGNGWGNDNNNNQSSNANNINDDWGNDSGNNNNNFGGDNVKIKQNDNSNDVWGVGIKSENNNQIKSENNNNNNDDADGW